MNLICNKTEDLQWDILMVCLTEFTFSPNKTTICDRITTEKTIYHSSDEVVQFYKYQ